MVILFLLFVAQFSIACACLAFNKDQQHKLAYEGWHQASMSLRNETQVYFNCCGFENASLPEDDPMRQPSCSYVCDSIFTQMLKMKVMHFRLKICCLSKLPI